MVTKVDPPPLPALIVGHVGHRRHHPINKKFIHRHYHWLVDLDDLPQLPWPVSAWATFSPEDHMDSGKNGTIKQDVVAFLTNRGTTVDSNDRILMLAHARVWGHVFDPLTVYWCVTPQNTVKAVLFEVHNTYGGRHVYMIDTDYSGNGMVDKAFYVSPFNDQEGKYRVMTTLRRDSVQVGVQLRRNGEPLIDTWVGGKPRRATPRSVAKIALTHPFMPQLGTLLIRVHGIALWARKLPIYSRPEPAQRHVQ